MAGEPPALVEDAALVVTELVTNALLHGSAPVVVGVSPLDGRVRLEVRDGGRMIPVVPLRSLDAMTGRGLGLVAALAAGWGVDPVEGGGKVVWAEMTATDGGAYRGGAATEVDVDAGVVDRRRRGGVG